MTYQLPACFKQVHVHRRWDLINNLLAHAPGGGKFLEIGTQSGGTVANVHAAVTVGVDPAPLPDTTERYTSFYVGTSDEFFALGYVGNFDVVLIDGLHHADQVFRDVENSLKYLAPGGTVVLHDCNPQSEEAQAVPQRAAHWNGDCWKAIVKLRYTRLDLDVFTIDIDEGLGIVRCEQAREPMGFLPYLDNAKSEPEWTWLTYTLLEQDRKKLLGLVSVDEGLQRLGIFSKIIELGGGHVPMFRPNVDMRPGPATDFTADFSKPLPIKTAEWDGVFSRFAVEHVSWRSVRGFLAEVYRILKPGGTAVLIIPNLYAQAKRFVARVESGALDDNDVCMIFGDLDYPENSHKSGFSPVSACQTLRDVGFAHVIVVPFGDLQTDMVVEAHKSITAVVEVPPVMKAIEGLKLVSADWANVPDLTDEKWMDLVREMASYHCLCPKSFQLVSHDGKLREVHENSALHWSRTFEWPWAILNGDFHEDCDVLDAGGGHSQLQYGMAKRSNHVTNLDLGESERAYVEHVRSALDFPHKIGFVQGDIAKPLAFSDGAFDRVVCCSVVEHIRDWDWDRSFREFVRVLKPGGILLLTMDVLSEQRSRPDRQRGHCFVEDRHAEQLLAAYGFTAAAGEPGLFCRFDTEGHVIRCLCLKFVKDA